MPKLANISRQRAAKCLKREKIEEEIARLEEQAALHIGKIAVTAGLADLNLDESILRREFEAIAARFRGRETGASAPPPESPRTNGTPPRQSHEPGQKGRDEIQAKLGHSPAETGDLTHPET